MKKSRKLSAIILSMLMIFSLAGCGSSSGSTADIGMENKESESVSEQIDAGESAEGSNDNVTQSEPDTQDTESAAEDRTESGSDILVVYFSRTGEQYSVGVIDKGNTEIVADMIIDETGADRFEIVPADDYYPYTYAELTDIAKQEQSENARPAYAGEAPNLSQYSIIYIGAPVWWGDWPMICYTFFENHADGLAGKTLIPFSTHAGSGLSGFDNKLAAACPNSTIGTGLAVSGSDAQNNQDSVRSTVHDWILGQ